MNQLNSIYNLKFIDHKDNKYYYLKSDTEYNYFTDDVKENIRISLNKILNQDFISPCKPIDKCRVIVNGVELPNVQSVYHTPNSMPDYSINYIGDDGESRTLTLDSYKVKVEIIEIK